MRVPLVNVVGTEGGNVFDDQIQVGCRASIFSSREQTQDLRFGNRGMDSIRVDEYLKAREIATNSIQVDFGNYTNAATITGNDRCDIHVANRGTPRRV